MYHAVDVWVSSKHLVDACFVRDVHIVELRPLATDKFDPVEDNLGRIVEVVENNNFIASLQQGKSSERPDIACTTRDMDVSARIHKSGPLGEIHADPVTKTDPTAIFPV